VNKGKNNQTGWSDYCRGKKKTERVVLGKKTALRTKRSEEGAGSTKKTKRNRSIGDKKKVNDAGKGKKTGIKNPLQKIIMGERGGVS